MENEGQKAFGTDEGAGNYSQSLITNKSHYHQ